jgi:curved DNA-binding protein
MKDYYGILGVQKTASADDIKKAYRKAAMKHHPDRGGDQARFKEINEAHDILSDKDKRMMVDQGVDPQNPTQRHYRSNNFNEGGFEDIFNNFGFNFGFGPAGFTNRPQQQRNKSLNVSMTLSLEEAFTGINKNITIKYPGGKDKNIGVNIPPGIDNGMAIRYTGMGDDSIPGIPAGDLTIVIEVAPHPVYAREGLNLLADVNVDCFDAMTGSSVEINTLDGRTLQVMVPAGTQPSTTLGLKNEGMRDQHGNVGKLYVRVNITLPKIVDPAKLRLIQQLKS